MSASHTVSSDAAVVIAVMMPLKLIVDVEKRKHNTTSEIDLSNPVQIGDDIYIHTDIHNRSLQSFRQDY